MNLKPNTFATERDQSGTREWSDHSYNICIGCAHGCLYCYANAQRCRFDRPLRAPGQWEAQRLNPNQRRLGAEVKPGGVVMFPTTHDLTPEFLPEALVTLKNLLRHHQVLVVTKPHHSVVAALCRELAEHKKDLLFRFTIGAQNPALCGFWEPGAPPPRERIQALQHAQRQGFATSVSIEPMLDSVDATVALVAHLTPWVTETLWIGKMQRVPVKLNAHVAGFAAARDQIRAQQTDAEILRLVHLLAGHSQVRWKDSIRRVIAKPLPPRVADLNS